MAYTTYYPNGWANNESGGTPINAAALNHIEDGIKAAHEAAEKASGGASDALTAAKQYSDTNLTTAKKYSDTNLTTAKTYADGRLAEAKSYTDQKESVLSGKIAANASAIAGLTTRFGGLTFAINADDLGLDIIIDE
jgi:trans-2-enoyl-CoA reductase